MRRTVRPLLCSALAAVLGLAGCGRDGHGLSETSADEMTGAVALSLTTVPADALCLRIVLRGAASVTRELTITAGTAALFTLDRLPTGLSTLDAQTFPVGCAALTATTAPSYVAETPLTVNLTPGRLVSAAIKLIANGRVGVAIDFEPAPPTARQALRLAVIGDTPYGPAQVVDFPNLVAALNADPRVQGVVHVGDIKNGSTRCDTGYFDLVAGHFAALADPLVFTPGDNEWTDCHRLNNGQYDPLERLAELRRIFYARPGQSLGAPRAVLSQATVPAHATFVENQLWLDASIVFSVVHVVGSNNGLAPWFGTDTSGRFSDDPGRRVAEVQARIAAALDWIDRSFDLAIATNAPGVAVFMQADTFQGGTEGFVEIVRLLAARARAFGKPVLLVQGDSHRYLVDRPLAVGDSLYGIEQPVPNLTRVVVEGETTSEYLLLTADPTAPTIFSWERVLRQTPAGRDSGAGSDGSAPVDGGAAADAGARADAGAGDAPRPSAGAVVVLNEVSSSPNPDWVELINRGTAPADLGGWSFTDNAPTEPNHRYTIPAGTVLAPGALLVLREIADFTFGLGNADAAILYDAAGAVVDQLSWTSHVSALGRCGDGVAALTPTPGAPNACP